MWDGKNFQPVMLSYTFCWAWFWSEKVFIFVVMESWNIGESYANTYDEIILQIDYLLLPCFDLPGIFHTSYVPKYLIFILV